jgi:hypothetical protein
MCHHGSMADASEADEIREYQLIWNFPPGPAPMVNQMLLQSVPDGDGGPGEIVVRLGYALPGPDHSPSEPVPVTTVAHFSLTRHRAEQLRTFLQQQIEFWDKADSAARGEK